MRMDPVERAIHDLRGRKIPPLPGRDDAAWWDHEAGKIVRGLGSKHLAPSGVRYRRLIRLRFRLRSPPDFTFRF